MSGLEKIEERLRKVEVSLAVVAEKQDTIISSFKNHKNWHKALTLIIVAAIIGVAVKQLFAG